MKDDKNPRIFDEKEGQSDRNSLWTTDCNTYTHPLDTNIHLSERSHIGKSEAAEIAHVPYVLIREDGDKNTYYHRLGTALLKAKRVYLVVVRSIKMPMMKGKELFSVFCSMILLESQQHYTF